MPADSIAPFILASAALSLAPGPDNLFVLSQSALYGKKSGIMITLGLCTGLMVHTAAVALGIAALIQTSTMAFNLLKWLGTIYLLYLAWQAARAIPSHVTTTGGMDANPISLYGRGIIMNLTNPKVSIFFLAFLPQFAKPGQGHVGLQIVFLGSIFISIALLIFSLIALLAGQLGQWLKHSPQAQAGLNRVVATVLVLLALRLATAEVA